jgi:type IX secretion system PorP/SprF family membrane protein
LIFAKKQLKTSFLSLPNPTSLHLIWLSRSYPNPAFLSVQDYLLSNYSEPMLPKYIRLLTLLFALFCSPLAAQDLQFSQFYASPLYLNPAFSGSAQGGRVSLNYRNQWPSTDANFVSYAGAFDYHFADVRSSIGAIVKVDEMSGVYKNTDFSLIYSYLIPISDKVAIQPALQGTYVLRTLGYEGLTFGDMFVPGFGFIDPTAEEFPRGRVNYLDISTGALVFGTDFWFGASVHHLNKPNESTLGGLAVLPTKISLHGGYRFNFSAPYEQREKSLTPNFMYKRQGTFQQLNLGAYATLEPLTFGLWYRGFPLIQTTEGFPVHDAMVLMAGVKFGDWNFGYSFDWAISELASINANSHEISLTYTFGSSDVTCPNPWTKRRRVGVGFRR